MTKNTNQKTFIFDFDGTIADSMAHVREMADEILPLLGIEKITNEQIEEMRKMTIAQGFRYLKIPIHKLPTLVVHTKQLMSKRLNKLEPIDGMVEVLAELRKKNVSLGILTSNSAHNVESFLKRHGIREYFDFVQSGAGLFTKNRKLKVMIRKYNLQLEDCVYFGDEIRDVEAAQAIRMPVGAVGWGVNHPDVLKARKPTYYLSSPKELLTIAAQ